MDLTKLTIPQKTIDDAFIAGYDCGKNGTNTANCHFSFFSSPDMTAAWERGKSEGEKAKSN